MSGITREIFSVLLKAEKPMSFGELQRELDVFDYFTLQKMLKRNVDNGRLDRFGARMHYSYALSAETRYAIETDGIAEVVRANRGLKPTARRNDPSRTNAASRMCNSDASIHAAQAAAILMHAPGNAQFDLDPVEAERLRSLAPSVGSVLPWLDEEEAPPVIGERWRDALRPRPLDD